MIEGFGSYGFPESHAASFALLVYVSAWLKRHHPAAFCAALLNSQPLGFYSPSEIVQDATRHKVEVRPVDVTVSDWHCTLEPGAEGHLAVRLGLLRVKGLSEEGAKRLVTARTAAPFRDLDDLAERASLSRVDLDRLAAADALRSLAGHRREALWCTLGTEKADGLVTPSQRQETLPALIPPTEGEDIVADYDHLGLTLRRHPLALLRPRLTRLRLRTAEEVKAARHGQLIRVAGLVTCRQRPETASGVTFVTLQDETGYVNVVVWSSLAERQRRELLGSRLMGVHGTIERKGEVVHLVAGKLVDHSELLGALLVRSRDFH